MVHDQCLYAGIFFALVQSEGGWDGEVCGDF